MSKRILSLVFIFFLPIHDLCVKAQHGDPDSLKAALSVAANDTIKLILNGKLATTYSEINPDSSYRYANEMLGLAIALDLPQERANALGCSGYALINVGNYPRSLQTLLSATAILEDPESERNTLPAHFDVSDEFTDRSAPPKMQRLTRLSKILQYLGILYSNAGYYDKSLYYFRSALPLSIEASNQANQTISYILLGRAYLNLKKYDSSLTNFRNAIRVARESGYLRYIGSALLNTGRIYMDRGDRDTARRYFNEALHESQAQGYFRGVVAANLALADLNNQTGQYDSSLQFITNGLPIAQYLNAPDLMLRSYTGLADYYKTVRNNDSIVKYQSLIIKIKDSLFNSKQAQQFQNIDLDEQQRLQQIEAAKLTYRTRFRMYSLITGILIFIFLAFILWRTGRQRKMANVLLSHQKEELERTVDCLKNTQRQLIQAEKMAAFGELTAGIAHEIQNPLNFVNNFSEVNRELIVEMKNAITKGDINDMKQIVLDMETNEERIISHGRRAESIVKGMLEHSRASLGHKEAIDVNLLTDEYLRVSYQGFKAKDKNFSARLETDYDQSIGKIEVVPQDLGRVLLNIFNNAFYTVCKKSKEIKGEFEPTVSVCTTRNDGEVEIHIRDNGEGISDDIRDKVFQPFFTTKPAGQGIGLGLSLAYDIIRAEGGDIRMKTREGEGTEFVIQLG